MDNFEIEKIELILDAVAEEKQLSAAMAEQGYSRMSPRKRKRFLGQLKKDYKTDFARNIIRYYKKESFKKAKHNAGMFLLVTFLFVTLMYNIMMLLLILGK